MALSGFVLVGFVFVHMAGNLQMFAGAEAINTYAYQLKALPWFVLWGSRLFLLAAVVVRRAEDGDAARPNEARNLGQALGLEDVDGAFADDA